MSFYCSLSHCILIELTDPFLRLENRLLNTIDNCQASYKSTTHLETRHLLLMAIFTGYVLSCMYERCWKDALFMLCMADCCRRFCFFPMIYNDTKNFSMLLSRGYSIFVAARQRNYERFLWHQFDLASFEFHC